MEYGYVIIIGLFVFLFFRAIILDWIYNKKKMKIYRVHFFESVDSSHGFGFYSNVADANKAINKWKKEYPNLDTDIVYPDLIEFSSTKSGIIDLLKRVASHPDNG